MVNVRLLEPRDIQRIVELEKAYLKETLGEELLKEEQKRMNREGDGVCFYVMEYNHRVIGYIGRYYFLHEAEILNFVIDEAYQRQGFGQLLWDCVVTDLKDVKKITLEVRSSNEKAIRFYQKNGFICVGKRKAYYQNQEDALLLLKEYI
ncbi:MAG: ribosomal protein S18-alanine N-acetyltransferase [Prevotella sp.]|nr:ribosomal protein S18-alanine N-acetyltransferase [Staphylococcus sp.]MCM1350557.1 ribosomal protein S18-alanine N-acetyltransferase [Prevotella sp.]